MPPTSNFGQDITNTNDNNNNRDGGDSNGNAIANIERMGGTMLLPKLAGKGVIRVVGRCEDAKENNKLGKFIRVSMFFFLIDYIQEFYIYKEYVPSIAI